MEKKSDMINKVHTNGGFQNSIGFVLACVGSAVGMGNIWMFPYRLGQYGGAVFLIPYLFFILLFGMVGLSAEFALGRKAGTGTLGAFELCWNKKNKGKTGYLLGWIPLMGALGIAIGYSVILGWVLRTLWSSIDGTLFVQESENFFAGISSAFGNIGFHSLVIMIACGLLLAGAARGIEKVNKVLMPAFFILFIVLAVRVGFLEGAKAGYEFLFVPKWEYLWRIDTWIMAMGQAFFSLSITGSGMIVYGSYLSKEEDIPKASMQTSVFDTLAAMLAALAIMPAVFAFGIEPGSGPSLMFVTLPKVFARMPFGRVFCIFFFLSVTFAGVTSLINMFESVAESWQNRFHIPRKMAILISGGVALAVGIFMEDGAVVGSWMDFVSIVITPLGALLSAVSIYYILGWKGIKEEMNLGRKKEVPEWFGIIGKYLYVPLAIGVFVLGILYGGIG